MAPLSVLLIAVSALLVGQLSTGIPWALTRYRGAAAEPTRPMADAAGVAQLAEFEWPDDRALALLEAWRAETAVAQAA